MSASKFAEANYIRVLNLEEILIYNVNEVNVQAVGKEIIKVWRCKESGLWRVPLKHKVENENVDNMILNQSDPGQSINNIYDLHRTKSHKLPAHMKCIPNKGNMAQRHKVRKIHHVARVYYKSNQQVLPRRRGNPKRAYATEKTRNNTNEIEYKGYPTFRG